MKIFDWLIRIQHLECYCQQICQSTTSGFTTMNSNVKELTPRMHNIVRCCTSKCKSRCRCCTFERRSHCNETFVMHECFKCRNKSCVQCVNLNCVPVKLFEIQIELQLNFTWPQISKTCNQLLKDKSRIVLWLTSCI